MTLARPTLPSPAQTSPWHQADRPFHVGVLQAPSLPTSAGSSPASLRHGLSKNPGPPEDSSPRGPAGPSTLPGRPMPASAVSQEGGSGQGWRLCSAELWGQEQAHRVGSLGRTSRASVPRGFECLGSVTSASSSANPFWKVNLLKRPPKFCIFPPVFVPASGSFSNFVFQPCNWMSHFCSCPKFKVLLLASAPATSLSCLGAGPLSLPLCHWFCPF